jgi:hypothetical protein
MEPLPDKVDIKNLSRFMPMRGKNERLANFLHKMRGIRGYSALRKRLDKWGRLIGKKRSRLTPDYGTKYDRDWKREE